MLRAVCVFCGSQSGNSPGYAQAARALGGLLAERGIELVNGGGRVGLMGRELGHTGMSELHVVGSMHERKALMARLSDAFIALPGGFGTFEEICEAITWAQLGLQPKPCALLEVEEYWAPLVQLFDQAVERGFLAPAARALVLHERDPRKLLDTLARRCA